MNTNDAKKLGRAAFHRGAECVPALDTTLMAQIPMRGSLPYLLAWVNGWTEENLAAPLPEQGKQWPPATS